MPLYAKQPKKLITFNILDILRKYSDENHRLSQTEILSKLESEYDMVIDRKAVKRNLTDLLEFGYEIECREVTRAYTDPRTGKTVESTILTDLYLVRDFTDAELRLLIDSLLFSRHVPGSQCKELVKKLEGLSNIYFSSRSAHVFPAPEEHTDNKQIFLNVELLDEAITKKCKVAFRYLEYGTDKKQHPRKRSDGSERYVVSPYQMAAKEGKYYLICSLDGHESAANYRLDRISDIEVLHDEHVLPFDSLRDSKGLPLDLADYMKKHIYMFSGENCRATFRIEKKLISDVIDLFGNDVSFRDTGDGGITVSVYANEMSVLHFAQNFAPEAILIDPPELKDKVKKRLEKTLERYEN
ncbi:MAG: WYL domain-containing protein [Lachnospiraceae bacterium]|nr:WYL domain-containing protein [Lachnospiraceae bacterium]